jgi:hypothetical protein
LIRARVSDIARPTLRELAAKAEPLYVSGLDAIIALDLPSVDYSTKRAEGRRIDPESGRVFHLDYDPPPTNEVRSVITLVPIRPRRRGERNSLRTLPGV